MAKNLLIVESPAKAKTIEKILGKDYTVKSSFGHVRDLEKTTDAVDVANNFNPHYVVTPDKRKVVADLKSWVKKVDEVWLATDEDREGEAISWHLCEVLGLKPAETKRIVFREITPTAIKKAITQPRTVDLDVVNAQQARRVLDRLVGYELSQVLWKKIKGGLSAGRVQSVTVKLVVEREREIQNFEVQNFYRINAIFDVRTEQGKTVALKAEGSNRFDDNKTAREFLQKCVDATFTIDKIEVRPAKRKPAPPFTTSTLQQEASRKLYFNVKRTMSVAQRLYEAGHITYMRTDSVSLSDTALAAIKDEVEKSYGAKYVKTRKYKGKSAGAQEAHEAIRPTYFEKHAISSGDSDEKKLYDLIWKRTVASQMADAELENTTVTIGISTVQDTTLKASGQVLLFDGFLKVYLESEDEEDDDDQEDGNTILPPLNEGQQLPLREMTATERFTRPPSRYTEAGLVKKLEELGIGRPSTYAPTITKIMDPARGYVTRESRDGEERKYDVLTLKKGDIKTAKKTETTGAVKNRLFASDIGATVSDFLDEHFDEVMNYSFTADIEEKFDIVSDGKLVWTDMLRDFYNPFHEAVEETTEQADRVTKERLLGTDPATGRTVLIRLSRNGPVVQLGAPDELLPDEKPRYGNLPRGFQMDDVTMEDAMKWLSLPRDLGVLEGEETVVSSGRYGPYLRYGDKFISLPKGEDPYEVGKARALELIAEYKDANRPIATYKDKPIVKGKGRFGPFVKWNGLFANVSKKYDFDRLTPAEAIELVQAKEEKEANRYVKRWEDDGIDIENGRWGPFIRFKKKSVKIPKNDQGERLTSEEAAEMTLEEVKALIEGEMPGAFAVKKKAAKKKAPAKKKKAAPKKKK